MFFHDMRTKGGDGYVGHLPDGNSLVLRAITLVLLGCALIVAAHAQDGFMFAGTVCAVTGLLLLSPTQPRRARVGARRRRVRVRKAEAMEGAVREAMMSPTTPPPPRHMRHPAV